MGFAGRPSEYKEEYASQLIEFMAQGYSYAAFAGSIRKAVRTLENWVETHPEFKEAKEIGFAACQYWWEREGKEGMRPKEIKEFDQHTGETKKTIIEPISAPMWIFNMKARFGFADRIVVQGDAEKPVQARLVIQFPVKDEGEKAA